MPTENDSPVGINEASRILGVSEPALRQWTDEGRIKSFVTPGGHRRYLISELKRFMSRGPEKSGLKGLKLKLEDTVSQHRKIADDFLTSATQYSHLDKESQRDFALLGRSLLNLIIKSISRPAAYEETLQEIRDTGRRYGELTASLGLPLAEALRTFIEHRSALINCVSGSIKTGETLDRRVADVIPVVDRVLDEAIIALVVAHLEHREGSGAGAFYS